MLAIYFRKKEHGPWLFFTLDAVWSHLTQLIDLLQKPYDFGGMMYTSRLLRRNCMQDELSWLVIRLECLNWFQSTVG